MYHSVTIVHTACELGAVLLIVTAYMYIIVLAICMHNINIGTTSPESSNQQSSKTKAKGIHEINYCLYQIQHDCIIY